jgi:hypothetical protein
MDGRTGWFLYTPKTLFAGGILMSIRTTFHRFVIWNVVLVYEKLSLLRQYSKWYVVPVWTTLHGYSLWNLVFKREIIYGQNFMYDYHEILSFQRKLYSSH